MLRAKSTRAQGAAAWNYPDFQRECDRRLLAQYAPATVFVNQDLEMVHSRGEVDRYLRLPTGRASLSILRMVREGLISELRSAVSQASRQNVTVRRKNLVVKNGKNSQFLELEVSPLRLGNLNEQYYMIMFHDSDGQPEQPDPKNRKAQRRKPDAAHDRRVGRLEQELAATKEYLQSLIESQEATNEELQSANEEILSSNEELQSTNEELETAKEELQSTNEELTTVNDELRNRNSEMTLINSDLNTLLATGDIGMVMLNGDLTIRRFTPSSQHFFRLIPADVGRPFLNIQPSVEIPDISSTIRKVMMEQSTAERNVRDQKGAQFRVRISPYRPTGDGADGVVITMMNISVANATDGDQEWSNPVGDGEARSKKATPER